MTTQQERDLYESFKKFTNLYSCNIHFTGEKLYKIRDHDYLTLNPDEVIKHPCEEEIAVKFPQSEYEKFLHNWANYIDILYTMEKHPIIKEEFQKLIMLVQLLK